MNIIAYKFGIDSEKIYRDSVSYVNNKIFLSNFSNQNPLDLINYSIDKHSFLRNRAIFERYMKLINETICNSAYRSKNYHIKKHTSKQMLTIFGVISIKVTSFTEKATGRYVDILREFCEMKKYERIDPNLRAIIVEKSATTSFSNIQRYLNEKTHSKVNFITRQTIGNIVKSAKLAERLPTDFRECKVLYIMVDEKYVSAQNNGKQKKMVKHAVVHEGTFFDTKTHRNKIRNKHVIFTTKDDLASKILDYIYDTYDVEGIEIIFKVADGAKWIKSMFSDVSILGTKSVRCIDRYHFMQAIWRMCLHKELARNLEQYALYSFKDFTKAYKSLLRSDPKRAKIIENSYKYVRNNIKEIRNLYSHQISCPMESQINFNVSKYLAQIPKGYSLTMIDSLLNIMEKYQNKEDVKQSYLYAYRNPAKDYIDDTVYSMPDNSVKTINTATIDYRGFRRIEKRIVT